MEKYTILPKNSIPIWEISFFSDYQGKLSFFQKKLGRIIHIKKFGEDLFKSLHFIHLYTHCTSFCFWCCFPYSHFHLTFHCDDAYLHWLVNILLLSYQFWRFCLWNFQVNMGNFYNQIIFNTVFLSNPYKFLSFCPIQTSSCNKCSKT